MTALSDINASGTGNWSDGSKWSGGVAPGAGQRGVIGTGKTITIASSLSVGGIKVDGGSLVINADVTFQDANYTNIGLEITATNSGGVTSNATASSPRLLQSASTNPTYPWFVLCYDIAIGTADARTLNFDYIEFRGNQMFLGNDTYVINFNGTDSTSPFITDVPDYARDQLITQNIIPGRATGRIHGEAEASGSLTIEGIIWKTAWTGTTIRNLQASFQRCAFFAHFVHLPSCKIESFRPGKRNGLWYPFTLTLVEDK